MVPPSFSGRNKVRNKSCSSRSRHHRQLKAVLHRRQESPGFLFGGVPEHIWLVIGLVLHVLTGFKVDLSPIDSCGHISKHSSLCLTLGKTSAVSLYFRHPLLLLRLPPPPSSHRLPCLIPPRCGRISPHSPAVPSQSTCLPVSMTTTYPPAGGLTGFSSFL